MDWENEKENIEKLLLIDKCSYEYVGRIYNVSGTYIKEVAIKLGIQITPRRKVNPKETFNRGNVYKRICENCGKEFTLYPHQKTRFCSIECSTDYKVKSKYADYINNPYKYTGQNCMQWVKKHILKEQNNKCAICGIENIWNNKKLVFILDHIDGHSNNNNRNNLRLVCPNCDSQLDTYKSKNKNSDREYYHYYHR